MASHLLRFSMFLQKYRTPVAVMCCGGVFAANTFYHVFPDQSYCQLYQAWNKGKPVELTEKLKGLFQQVLKDYGVGSAKNFSAFASYGCQPLGAGIPWFPAGARIGIPDNFNCTPDDQSRIIDGKVFVDGKMVDWSSKDGCTLKEALVFSENAQKFAVALEVARLQSGGPILMAAVTSLCLGVVWVCSVWLKLVFGLSSSRLLFRGFANVAALGIGAVPYFLTSDALSHWLNYSADRRVARVSREYAEGGLEFYDKILSRNKALRSLMGQTGRKTYAPSGNLFPSNIFKLRHTPYTSRRERILTLLKEKA